MDNFIIAQTIIGLVAGIALLFLITILYDQDDQKKK